MSKRRVASLLMFNKKRALKYPVNVVVALSGTGTATRHGTVTLVASNVATQAYVVVTSGTNVGVLVGTAVRIGTGF